VAVAKLTKKLVEGYWKLNVDDEDDDNTRRQSATVKEPKEHKRSSEVETQALESRLAL